MNNGCFELTVTNDDGKKNYAGSSHINVSPTILDLYESDNAQDFTITVTGTTDNPLNITAGDTVEFKYWPRIQASSGNSGYTRAFCTWKMVAKKDTNNNNIVLSDLFSALCAQGSRLGRFYLHLSVILPKRKQRFLVVLCLVHKVLFLLQ